MGERAALLAGLVYVYSPYHLLDVYVRGALAETVALVFLPLCLWSFDASIERPRMAAIVGAAAVVTKDVAPGQRMLGAPATPEREQKRVIMSLDKLPAIRRDVRKIKQHLGLPDDDT